MPLLDVWADHVGRQGKPMAVCVDTRSESSEALHQDLCKLREQKNDWKLVFLEADSTTLLRRYSTLRRRHPFARVQYMPYLYDFVGMCHHRNQDVYFAFFCCT